MIRPTAHIDARRKLHRGPEDTSALRASVPLRLRAFSLLELVAVLMVLAVVMAIVAPSMRNFAQGRELADTARSLTTLAAWARSQAISEGRPYRLHVDVEQRACYVTAENAGAFERIESSLGRSLTFPDRLSITWENSHDAQQRGHVTFHPSGRLTPAVIALRDQEGFVTRVGAEAPTDRFVVLSRQREGGTR